MKRLLPELPRARVVGSIARLVSQEAEATSNGAGDAGKVSTPGRSARALTIARISAPGLLEIQATG
jgi:hypothetical protein